MSVNVLALLEDLGDRRDRRVVPLSPEIELQMRAAETYRRAARNPNTTRCYLSDWAHFEAYCERHAFQAMPAPPEVVRLYITSMAALESTRTKQPLTTRTISRRITTLRLIHELAGYTPPPTQDPLVQETWRGIRTTHGVAPTPKEAISLDLLKQMLAPLGEDLTSLRDRALLLLAFTSALRRHNLAAIRQDDLRFDMLGVRIRVRFSKTNQMGREEYVSIRFGEHRETCPVRALQRWLAAARIEDGTHVFRKVERWGRVSADVKRAGKRAGQPNHLAGDSIARIIKKAAVRIGLDPKNYAGHSMRRGFITHSKKIGKSDETIMRQTKQTYATLQRYKDQEQLWDEHPTEGLGL